MQDALSLQLWSVRKELDRNFDFTLRTVAEMGYSGVEFAGNYGGYTAPALKALLERLHLRPVAAHVAIDLLETDFDAQADYLTALGCDHIVVPWMDVHDETSAAEAGQRLELAAEKCIMRGMKLSYHNHAHEYAKTGDGRYLADILMESCSELVFLEPDTCWIAWAGADPVQEIRKYAGRGELLHLKQFTGTGDGKTLVPFDKGSMDLCEIMANARLMGFSEFIIEEESKTEDSLDAVRIDMETFRKLC